MGRGKSKLKGRTECNALVRPPFEIHRTGEKPQVWYEHWLTNIQTTHIATHLGMSRDYVSYAVSKAGDGVEVGGGEGE